MRPLALRLAVCVNPMLSPRRQRARTFLFLRVALYVQCFIILLTIEYLLYHRTARPLVFRTPLRDLRDLRDLRRFWVLRALRPLRPPPVNLNSHGQVISILSLENDAWRHS